jgi:hypothetical protein
MFAVCTTGDTAHIDMTFKFLPQTNASTWLYRYSSQPQWSVPLGQRGHVAMVGRILCTKFTLHSDHRLTVWYSNTQNDFPPEWPFSHYINSHRLAAEMWTTMKNNLLGKQFLSCSIYLYRFRKYLPYRIDIINFCNPGAHSETPCITVVDNVNLLEPELFF